MTDIAPQRRRVARHIGHRPRSEGHDAVKYPSTRAVAGRIEYDDVHTRDALRAGGGGRRKPRLDRSGMDSHLGQIMKIASGIPTGEH